MKNKILCLALIASICLSLAPTYVFSKEIKSASIGTPEISYELSENDKTADNIKVVFNYAPTVSGSQTLGRATCYYRDSYFSKSSYEYNPHLSTMSIALAMSAFQDEDRLYNDVYKNAEDLFFDIGFECFESNIETDIAPTTETMGLVMAKKTIEQPDGAYTLVAIAFRGSGYGSEWANNFIVGTEENSPEGHKGFVNSRDHVLPFILDYLDRNVKGDAKLWLTGFSRGGALSGITGAWLNDNINEISKRGITISNEDIFTYAFEAPTSIDERLNNQRNYDNIFNIVSPNDMIPRLPFEQWGIVRPGIVKLLPTFYGKEADSIKKVLKEINPAIVYSADNFVPFINSVGKTQAEYLDNCCKLLASKIDRTTYATKVELPISHMLDKLLNGSEGEIQLLANQFANNFLADMDIDISNLGMDGIISLVLGMLGGDESFIDKLCNALGKNLEESGFIAVFDEETYECLFTLTKAVLDKSFVPYVVTLLRNINIIDAHFPEIIFAALITQDDYYSSSQGSVSWSSGYSSKENIITVAINDGEKIYGVDFPKGTTVTLKAHIPTCLDFDGWYKGDECITSDYEYSFVARENFSIAAKTVVNHKSLGDWEIKNAEFAFSSGLKERECAACGARFEEIIPAPLGELDGGKIAIIATVSSVALLSLIGSIVFSARARRKKKSKKEENKEA